jgi:hypothetical protein
MPRLNIERQNELEPKRIQYAIEQITKLGHEIVYQDNTKIQFMFQDKKVTLYPYSGYFNGKSVKAGRGIDYLLSQIKNKTI